MHHQTRLVHLGIDFPDFLDANRIGLRILASIELVLADQLLAQMTTRAFGKEGVFGMQFHTELKCRSRLTMTIHAHVAGGNTLDRAVVVIQDFGGRKAGEDFDAERFGLLTEPARDIGQRHDVIAVILETGWQCPGRCLEGFAGAEKKEAIFGHRCIERCAAFFPVGEQFADRLRVHHRAVLGYGHRLRCLFQLRKR